MEAVERDDAGDQAGGPGVGVGQRRQVDDGPELVVGEPRVEGRPPDTPCSRPGRRWSRRPRRRASSRRWPRTTAATPPRTRRTRSRWGLVDQRVLAGVVAVEPGGPAGGGRADVLVARPGQGAGRVQGGVLDAVDRARAVVAVEVDVGELARCRPRRCRWCPRRSPTAGPRRRRRRAWCRWASASSCRTAGHRHRPGRSPPRRAGRRGRPRPRTRWCRRRSRRRSARAGRSRRSTPGPPAGCSRNR